MPIHLISRHEININPYLKCILELIVILGDDSGLDKSLAWVSGAIQFKIIVTQWLFSDH